jgi:tetratricopeptide (TPR) repeat protein
MGIVNLNKALQVPRHSSPWITWRNAIGAMIMMLASSTMVLAQAEATVLVDRNPAEAGKAFRITFEFKGVNVQFKTPPKIQGLRYLSGPSTSSSTQIINGAMTSKRSYTYSALVTQPGTLSIPAFSFNTSEGRLRSKAIDLKVVKQGSKAGQSAAQFEAVIETDKKKVHLGEPVRVQYRIYNRLDAVDVRNYSFPELSGVWKENVEGEDPRWENTIVDGKRIQVATVRTDILYPTRTGKLDISGFNVEAQMRVSFFNTRPLSSDARPVSIEVLPLPTPTPASSLGTFRKLTATWKADGQVKPKANEAINLTLEFKGNGNLGLIGAPEIIWPKDLEVFDPEIQDRITKDFQGQRGRRTLTYLVIPRAEGTYEIDLPELSYYDHGLDRFVTLTPPPVTLDVTGSEQAEGPAFGFNSKTDVTILTRDMRFIRTETELKPRSHPFFGGPFHMALLGLPPLGFLIGWGMRRRKNNEVSNPALMRKRQSKAQLKAALNGAKKGGGSFDDLGQAAHEFLQGQLGIPRSDAGMDKYRDRLSGFGEELQNEWFYLIQTLDQGRFAPGAPNVADVATRLEAAAKALESERTPSSSSGTPASVALLLILAAIPGWCWAAPDALAAQTAFNAGNAAYLEGDFDAAVASYSEAAELWTSFELEYNLGVAHYKSGRIGPSILHFERAKRIQPSDDDLHANLLLARSSVVDRIEEMPEIALAPLWRELTSAHRLFTWTVSSLALWMLTFLLLYVRMAAQDMAMRRGLAIVTPILGLLALLLGFLGRETDLKSKSNDGAVIMSPRIEVLSSPSNSSEASKLFVIHEGTVIQILRTEGLWHQVRLANGNTGWVENEALTPI